MARKRCLFHEMMMILIIMSVLVLMDFYSFCSLKRQFMCRYVAKLGHILLIPSQPACAITPKG